MLGKFFKNAREHLGLSANRIAKTLRISDNTIADVEKNKTKNINWFYFEFLISKGINAYYLLGKSDKMMSDINKNPEPQESFEKETFSGDLSAKHISERFKKAREHIGISQNKAAKKIGLSNTTIHKLENGSSNKPNFEYMKFLASNGINPFYLLGLSEEMETLDDCVSKEEHQAIVSEKDKALDELRVKVDVLNGVMQMLKIEIDEDGNVRKKGKASNLRPSRPVKIQRGLDAVVFANA